MKSACNNIPIGLARLVQKLPVHTVPSNRPVVGEQLFHIESGIIASWRQNCGDTDPTLLFPYHWDVVGQPPAKVVLGKGSGIDSIKSALKKASIEASEEQAMQIVLATKDFSMRNKRLLTDAEFLEVATETLHKVAVPQTAGT